MAVVHPIVSTEIMNGKSGMPFYRGLFSELQSLGHIEGNNLIVERRSGEGKTERYAEIARELVNLKPDVMVVTSARFWRIFDGAALVRSSKTSKERSSSAQILPGARSRPMHPRAQVTFRSPK